VYHNEHNREFVLFRDDIATCVYEHSVQSNSVAAFMSKNVLICVSWILLI